MNAKASEIAIETLEICMKVSHCPCLNLFTEKHHACARLKKTSCALRSRPYVMVELVFDRGLLSISIKNIGARPAFAVRVHFSHKLMGCNGSVEVPLSLFRALEFLPGGEDITTLSIRSVSYFRSKQPVQFTTDISYRDSRGSNSPAPSATIWKIYRQITYTPPP